MRLVPIAACCVLAAASASAEPATPEGAKALAQSYAAYLSPKALEKGIVTVTPDVANQLNYNGKGVAVEQVVQGSAADSAGLQPGDVIQKANGQDVTSGDQLRKIIQQTKPGSTISLQVWSGGVKRLVSIKVQERPAEVGSMQQQGQQGPPGQSGQPEEQP